MNPMKHPIALAIAAALALPTIATAAVIALIIAATAATTTPGAGTTPAPYQGQPLYPLPSEQGRISYFGDPTECQPMALWPQWGNHASCDMNNDPTLRYFIAMRWPDYPNSYPWLRQQRILLTLPRTGKSVVVVPGDWGPAQWTHRDFDVSNPAITALNAQTDDTITARYVHPNTPTGPTTNTPPIYYNTPTTNCANITGPVPANQTTHTKSATGDTITTHPCLAPQLTNLINAAQQAHLPLTGWGWRSTQRQIELRSQPSRKCGNGTLSHYDIYEAPANTCTPPTARPGASQHERGLAIDFTCNGNTLTRTSPCYRWLTTHAHQYGLKNLPTEPWHWSTTGR